MKTYGDLKPGDTFGWEAPIIGRVVLTVVSVEPTGSVVMGQSGPDATPIMRVTVTGMPSPFKGVIETAANKPVAS